MKHWSWSLMRVNIAQNTRLYQNDAILNGKIDNFQATKLIKKLYCKKHGKCNKKMDKENIVKSALQIFDKISETKNNFSINTLLTLFLHFECTQKINLIWNDIDKLSKNKKDISNCYTLLILCCVKSLNIDKCIEVLSWIEKHNHTLTLTGNIAKLLNKCKPTISHLKYIEYLMNKKVINQSEYIQSALIINYCKHKDIPSALNIFNCIENINIITINAMLTTLVNNGYNREALELYQSNNINLNTYDSITHYMALTACKNLKDYNAGHSIFKTLTFSNNDIKLKTAFIDFFGIFNDVTNALDIFQCIKQNEMDIICIGAMMKVLVNNGFYKQAIELFDGIDDKYRHIVNCKDPGCYVLALKACAGIKDMMKGEIIYNNIPQTQRNINVITSFIDFCGQCLDINKAEYVYNKNKIPQNIVCTNAMLTAYINNLAYDKALQLYDTIYIEKTDTTHVLAITACSKSNNFGKGNEIYLTVKDTDNIRINTSLIDLFGNVKDIKTALNIFHKIKKNNINIIAINAMLTALVNKDCNKEALNIYNKIKINKDITTYIMAIKACGNLQYIANGENIYTKQIPYEYADNIQIKTVLIQFYGQCNDIKNALNIFNKIEDKNKNIVCINTMLSAYIKCNVYDAALQLFDEMSSKYGHITKDNVLYSVAIKACTLSNNFKKGQEIHNEIVAIGLISIGDIQLHLINMYSKCGMINVCNDIFDEIKKNENKKYLNDINIWNEMINAHLRNNSDVFKAKQLLAVMKNETDLKPNHKTYSLVLNGCSHTGNIKEATDIWEYEISHSIKYDSYIIATLVDCCSRKGYLYQGYEWIYKYEKFHNKQANKQIDHAMWMSLLHGSKQQNNLLMAHYIHDQICCRFKTDKKLIQSGSILLANIYQYHRSEQLRNMI